MASCIRRQAHREMRTASEGPDALAPDSNALPIALFLACLLSGPALCFALSARQAVARDAAVYPNPGSTGFDLVSALPPAPKRGDPRDRADRAIFKHTRRLAGSPRWGLATRDADMSSTAMLRNFSCAAGLMLSPETTPLLTALLESAGRGTALWNERAKQAFRRPRPFLRDKGPVCQPRAELTPTFDYPSGHATLGWTWAAILAELLPERADRVLARGRAYGESRIVCGAHNTSAVEAGHSSAMAALVRLRASPAYQADFAAARTELAALSAHGAKPDAAGCRVEAGLIDQHPY